MRGLDISFIASGRSAGSLWTADRVIQSGTLWYQVGPSSAADKDLIAITDNAKAAMICGWRCGRLYQLVVFLENLMLA